MPIKWNALKVSEAAGMIEEYLDQAAEPLDQARIVANEALNISDIPKYIKDDLFGILAEIERVTGGEHTFGDKAHYAGAIKRAIERLRASLPHGAVEADQTSQKYGSTPALI